MSRSLLNANQQRRVATSLRLLRQDLASAALWPELRSDEAPQRSVRELVGRVREAVVSAEAALGLPAERPIPAARRLGAMAEVWANRLADLRSHALKTHGRVHPELGAVLDPKLREIAGLLDELREAAARLPAR